MTVILLMLPATLLLALIFLIAYIWSIRTGQYDDTHTPSIRMLADDPPEAGLRTTSKTNSSSDNS